MNLTPCYTRPTTNEFCVPWFLSARAMLTGVLIPGGGFFDYWVHFETVLLLHDD